MRGRINVAVEEERYEGRADEAERIWLDIWVRRIVVFLMVAGYNHPYDRVQRKQAPAFDLIGLVSPCTAMPDQFHAFDMVEQER